MEMGVGTHLVVVVTGDGGGNDDQYHCLSFGCHVAVGDVAPVSELKKMDWGEGDVNTHLGVA